MHRKKFLDIETADTYPTEEDEMIDEQIPSKNTVHNTVHNCPRVFVVNKNCLTAQGSHQSDLMTLQGHVTEALKSLRLSWQLPSASHATLSPKTVRFAPRSGKTLVLDLDETLVHCVRSGGSLNRRVFLPRGRTEVVSFDIRPYAREFLVSAASAFEVVVFTASCQPYADAILDTLDPQRTLIRQRLYREHCTYVDGVYVKDLRVLVNRKLEDVVILDNLVHSFAYQLSNGVPIRSWYGEPEDTQLMKVQKHLELLHAQRDVRLLNERVFGFEHARQSANLQEQLTQAFFSTFY